MSEAARLTAEEIRSWRSEFPILAERSHLANCSHAPQARRVREAIEGYLDGWGEVGMDWDRWMADVEAARRGFARLIGAEPEEVAISTSASAAVASIASGLEPEGTRRRVVTTEAEFPTVAHVWLARARHGLEVDFVPLRGDRLALVDYELRVDERTLITSATHVHYRNGFKQDVAAIAEIVHAEGSLLLVDAYQSLGTCAFDVGDLDVDIVVSGTLKYLLGCPGIAFIYVRRELIERLEPSLTGWFGRADPFAFDPRTLDWADSARRLETGTPPVFAAVAARAGLEIIAEVGPSRIERHLRDLSIQAIEAANRAGLDYAGPEDPDERGAVVAIRVDDAQVAEARLRERGIVASARGEVIRLAPHFFTTPEELDQAVMELEQVVGETAAS